MAACSDVLGVGVERYPEFTALVDPASLSVVGLQDIGTDGARFQVDLETDDVDAEVVRLVRLGAEKGVRRKDVDRAGRPRRTARLRGARRVPRLQIGVPDPASVGLDADQLAAADEHPAVASQLTASRRPSGPLSTTSLMPSRSSATISSCPTSRDCAGQLGRVQQAGHRAWGSCRKCDSSLVFEKNIDGSIAFLRVFDYYGEGGPRGAWQ